MHFRHGQEKIERACVCVKRLFEGGETDGVGVKVESGVDVLHEAGGTGVISILS